MADVPVEAVCAVAVEAVGVRGVEDVAIDRGIRNPRRANTGHVPAIATAVKVDKLVELDLHLLASHNAHVHGWIIHKENVDIGDLV